MRTNMVQPEAIEESLSQLQEQNKAQAGFLADVQQLAAQLRMDMICGSWISTGGVYSLLVRRCSMGYMFMICDNSRCYKTIVREMLAVLEGERLLVEADGRNEAVEIVFDSNGLLHCGTYGVFCMEENLLHEEMQNEIEFAMRSTYPEESYE